MQTKNMIACNCLDELRKSNCFIYQGFGRFQMRPLDSLQLSFRQITAENIITLCPRISLYNGQQNESERNP